jgi:hypothetical protein
MAKCKDCAWIVEIGCRGCYCRRIAWGLIPNGPIIGEVDPKGECCPEFYPKIKLHEDLRDR